MILDSSEAIPDVTGYKLETAKCILKEAGVEILSIVFTSAPLNNTKYGYTVFTSSTRVLRQKLLDGEDAVELTVCKL